ncbi:hypothetical protein SAMN05443252_105162 [Bacillus sp. OV322]|uniref:hypothetical protein n=1 Tax=Bacillus sp. OV322 TaxID=1882764 RepID=UPI0008EEF393|nr:hypothetical protein [Bacillus sp. OV322]SFC66678.1 hypothetical protein SAMN05443252_105162 [Bacillus sp. OV322]
MVLIISGILHILFGLVLIPYSLIAAITFFIIDKILEKKKTQALAGYKLFFFY